MKDEVVVSFESGAIADPNEVRIRRLHGREQLGQLYEFEIHLICANPDGLDDRALLSAASCLVFTRTSTDAGDHREMRRVFGIVASVRDRCFTESAHREYFLRFVPRAWRASLTRTTDIYMDMSVQDIIKQKLSDAGLSDSDVQFRLMDEDPPREFVVQYKETDLAFISRMAEDAGITMFFEQDESAQRDIVVFADNNDAFDDVSPDTVPFSPRGDRQNVFELEATRRLITTAFKSRDYNYRNPSMDLLGEAKIDALGGGMDNDYGDHVRTPAEANRVAKIRAEEQAVDHYNLYGRAEIPQFRAGGTVTIENHPHSAAGKLLLVEVTHDVEQTTFGMSDGTSETYHCDFRAIPLSTPYRPPRITPKPVVPGVVTGLVEHGSDTELGAVDEHGRYRVSFMYDSVADREPGKASRPLRMAQPSAGPDRGMHIPLKPGTEVIITCVNGDPDRPIIAGAVPNPQTYSPVNSSNAEKSIITVNKSTLAFDDREARLKITVGDEHAEENVLQIGAPNAAEQGILLGTVGNATQIANGVFTHIGDSYATFSNAKTDICSNNIVTLAGQPHPMGYWQKGEKLAKDVIAWGKAAAAALDSYKELSALPAKKQKEAAEQKLAAAKQEDAQNPSAKSKKKVARAQADVAAKDAALTKTQASWDALAAEVASSSLGEAAAAAEKGIEFIEAAVKPLHSMMSKMTSALTTKLMHGVTKDAHERMAQAAKDAEERVEADIGSFAADPEDEEEEDGDKPKKYDGMKAAAEGEALCLAASTHTAAMMAEKNAFVFGIEYATLGSDKVASLISGESAHIKAVKAVELCAVEDVKITANDLIDLQSDVSVKIVGHADETEANMPSDCSVFILSDKGTTVEAKSKHIWLDAKDGGIFAHASATAALSAGGGFGVVATDSDVNIGALSSADSDGVSAGSDKICIKDGKIEAEGGGAKLKLDGKCTIEGDKILLG